MSSLQRVQLNYHVHQHRWQIKVNRPVFNKVRENRRVVYWGAEKVPLPLTYSSGSKVEKKELIACHAFVNLQEQTPYLHPLIGILTTHKEGHYPFAGRKSNFIDIIRTGYSKGAIVFVFTPQSVDWEAKTIRGYLYQAATKQWKLCKFPFPNVVYNRIPSREEERTVPAVECIQKLKEVSNLTLFNPHFFNKFELYELLNKTPDLQGFLPETTSLQSAHDLQIMLNKHRHVYLKPTKGKAGAGIMRVVQSANNQYSFYIQRKNILKQVYCKNLTELWSKIRENSMSSPYIAQQGINLAKINRCPFDFRVLVQKNGQGEWEVAGLGMRVAGVNRITTHVPRGGRIERPSRVLTQLFSAEEAAQIEQRVERLAIAIAQSLEGHYSLLGEMSMDIGLDSHGNLWFFEANSKPMKFDEPDIRRRSLNNLIYYAQYLTLPKQKGRGLVHVYR